MPWGGLLLALLLGISTAERSEEVGAVLLLLSAILFGLPHGACDFWLLKRRALEGSPDAPNLRLISTLSLYTAAAAAIVGFWAVLPEASMVCFLLLTAAHFGSGDEVWEPGGTGTVPSFLRGLVVVASPLAFHPDGSERVLRALVGNPEHSAAVVSVLAVSPFVLAGAAFLLLVRDIAGLRRGIPFPLVKWAELSLLLVLFGLTGPLFAVAAYFVAVHSWRHMLRLETYGDDTVRGIGARFRIGGVIQGFYRKALPVTALTLAALAFVFVVFRNDASPLLQWSSAYLILLSALTVPHAFLIRLTESELARR